MKEQAKGGSIQDMPVSTDHNREPHMDRSMDGFTQGDLKGGSKRYGHVQDVRPDVDDGIERRFRLFF
jgi:hypothetical protein